MEEKLDHLRHSLAHLLGAAVQELYGTDAKLAIGPAIENGFYYDIEFPTAKKIREDELVQIELKMKEILPSWKGFERKEVTEDAAKSAFTYNPYKLELISEIAAKGEPITLYTSGKFTDLCRGGHLDTLKNIDTEAFTLSHIAGAYWRGDEKNTMLTRIYGIAFETKEELSAYQKHQEEARQRDHRKIAKEQDLLVFSDLVGSGMPIFTPKGNVIRNEIVNFSRELNRDLGFDEVHTPNINKAELFKISGHYDQYKEDMLTVCSQYSEEDFFLKPMNCPQHTQIYASHIRSYRDLPIRYSDFANLYRDERPGELSGLTRLRAFAQDDGHVFCREDQVETELSHILNAVEKALTTYSIEYWMRLSLSDPEKKEKYLGDPKSWAQSESIIRKLLTDKGIENKEALGEAAFYGPKIDVMAVDALGREWQISTIQLDFTQPERFNLTYVDSDGTEKTPVMIHRALVGSPDRFMGILIEHYAGAFPLWLSPVHVTLLPVSEKFSTETDTLAKILRDNDIRVQVDAQDESLGKRIRNSKTQKVPYLLVVGEKEIKSGSVTLEGRGDEKVPCISIHEAVAFLTKRIRERSL